MGSRSARETAAMRAVRMLRTADRQYKRYEQPRRCGPCAVAGDAIGAKKFVNRQRKIKYCLQNGRTGDKLVPMEIWKIDQNFAPGKVRTEGDVVHYALPCVPFDLYGIFYDEAEKQFARLPADVAAATSEGVVWLRKHTSGGRLRFSTDSDYFEVAAQYKMFEPYSHMPLSGSCGFALVDETDPAAPFLAGEMRAEATNAEGFASSCLLPGDKMRQYTLYFPLYNEVTGVQIGLKEGAAVQGGRAYRKGGPVLYYGSSITQGGCASRPDNCYPAYISQWTNTDYINLGFSGNGKAEPAMVEYLASLPCRAFVCDYDHNAPDAEYLEKTHRPLYETFRAAQPQTPILFMTKPDFENEPQADLRRSIIRATYEYARKNGDKNVYFLDGETLFGKEDRMHCTVDKCHPNDLGFYRMAKAVYAKLCEAKVFD